MKHLVLMDTDRIQNLVFGGNKLREVRGASALLDYLNRSKAAACFESVEPSSLVYAHGGMVMGCFSSPEHVQEAMVTLEREYCEASGGQASITGGRVAWNGEAGDAFRTAFKTLGLNVRLAKLHGPPSPVITYDEALLHFCQSCGAVPARAQSKSDRRILCSGCWSKATWSQYIRHRDRRQEAVGWTDTFIDQLQERPEWPVDLESYQPEDLPELGMLSKPQHYVGMIYCDINNLGTALSDIDDLETLRQTAQDIDRNLRETAFDVIDQYLQPRRHPETKKWLLPFEMVFVGGDDLVMLTAADRALDVASALVERFHYVLGVHNLTLSAGGCDRSLPRCLCC